MLRRALLLGCALTLLSPGLAPAQDMGVDLGSDLPPPPPKPKGKAGKKKPKPAEPPPEEPAPAPAPAAPPEPEPPAPDPSVPRKKLLTLFTGPGDLATPAAAATFAVDRAARFEKGFEALGDVSGELAPPSGDETAAMAAVESALKEGMNLYGQLELDGSVEQLLNGVKLYREQARLLPNGKGLAAAMALLGGVEAVKGEPPKAKAAFRRAAQLDAAVALDPNQFPPEAVSLLGAEKANAARMGPAPLTVTSTPPGAAVFLDGKLVGATPLVLDRVTMGQHLLQIRRVGWSPAGAFVDVQPQGTSWDGAITRGHDTDAFEAALAAAQSEAMKGGAACPSVKALARLAGAERVVLGTVATDAGGKVKLSASAFGAEGQRLGSAEASAPASSVAGDAATKELARELLEAAAREPAPLAAIPRGKKEEKPEPVDTGPKGPGIGERLKNVPTWVWIVAGVVVVGAAGGATYAATRDTSPTVVQGGALPWPMGGVPP